MSRMILHAGGWLAAASIFACTETSRELGDFDGNAGFGDVCRQDADCASDLCTLQAGTSVRRCTATCSASQACPADLPSTCGASGQCDILTTAPLSEDPNVAFLYVGPVLEHGWALAHEESRLALLEHFPQATAVGMPTEFLVDVPEQIDQLVADGVNVVVGTSFDFLDVARVKANEYPDVNFLVNHGFRSDRNLGSYSARMYQSVYLMGYLAGSMTLLPSSNQRMGLLATLATPETIRRINAFAIGVHRANPNAEVYLEWTESRFNPPIEAEKTEFLLADADIELFMGMTDTLIPLEVAAAGATSDGRPVLTIGYNNADTCSRFAQDRCLSVAHWNWGAPVIDIVQRMMDGTWDPSVLRWDRMQPRREDSGVHFAEPNPLLVPSAVQTAFEQVVMTATQDSVQAEQMPFDPDTNGFAEGIRDIAGAVRIPPGQPPTDPDLLSMCWLVEGLKHADGSPATLPGGCAGDL